MWRSVVGADGDAIASARTSGMDKVKLRISLRIGDLFALTIWRLLTVSFYTEHSFPGNLTAIQPKRQEVWCSLHVKTS